MRRCQDVLLHTKDCKRKPEVRPVRMTEDAPARDILQYVHFTSLELYEPEDEAQTGFGFCGKCDWEKGRDIEAVILDGRLIFLSSIYLISPWKLDQYRAEYIEEAGSADCFDEENFAL